MGGAPGVAIALQMLMLHVRFAVARWNFVRRFAHLACVVVCGMLHIQLLTCKMEIVGSLGKGLGMCKDSRTVHA